MLSIIKKITDKGFRIFEQEKETRDFIKSFLDKKGFSFVEQKFEVKLPDFKKHYLKVDGEKISSEPVGLKSGKIKSKEFLSNPLRDSKIKDKKAIIFNPFCEDISLHTFYFAPALSVCYKNVNKILEAFKIEGFVKVEKKKDSCANILVGNTSDPKNVIFSHYDSLKKGSVDNASGTAVCLSSLKDSLLKESLFVFSGSEELSYEKPVYWGFGYREFEKAYKDLLKKAKKIVVVDSIGHSSSSIIESPALLNFAFPVKNKELIEKTKAITGDTHSLMNFYHSDLDTLDKIDQKYLKGAKKKLLEIL